MTKPTSARLLVLAALTLAACEPKPAPATTAAGCTAEEMRTRQARTPACQAQFRDLLDRAEADRRRNSAISSPPPAPARDRF
jgi:entry exclusion lipoprotein TrbK